jgi:hypothetical protein
MIKIGEETRPPGEEIEVRQIDVGFDESCAATPELHIHIDFDFREEAGRLGGFLRVGNT